MDVYGFAALCNGLQGSEKICKAVFGFVTICRDLQQNARICKDF